MTGKYTKKLEGFTLVELSIVIIIIGFLIVGIAAGQSLLKQAKLNSIIVDIKESETAVNAFKSVYSYMPGDLPNATAFWPSEVCTANGGAISCNGNGNGLIDNPENTFAWDHLNQSDIMVSLFDDYTPYPTLRKTLTYNKQTFMTINNWGGLLYDQDLTSVTVFDIGSTSGNFILPAYMSPVDAFTIDNKMDDGNPSTGKMLVSGHVSLGDPTTYCVLEGDGATPVDLGVYPNSDAKYDLNNSNLTCNSIIYTLN